MKVDPAIVTALIGATIAVVSMIQSSRVSKREAKGREAESLRREQAEERLRQLEVDLDAIRGEQAARISYEYEARKRLYAEVGALQFQLGEAAEDARQRVVSLARSARKGALAPGDNWLAADDYYMRTTVYYLFAPLAILRLIQRRLTSIDLELDHRVRAQYHLLRVLSWSFSEGHELAAVEGRRLKYDPDWEESRWRDLDDEARQRPQHLPLGNIAKPVEALIVDGTAEAAPRIVSYGEFVRELDDDQSEISQRFRTSVDINPFKLFSHFHPERRPVLWRVLAYQLLLYDALITVGRLDEFDPASLASYLEPSDAVAEQCRWRYDQPVEEARLPFDAAHTLLATKLEGVRNPLLRR